MLWEELPGWTAGLVTGIGGTAALGLLVKALLGILTHRRETRKLELTAESGTMEIKVKAEAQEDAHEVSLLAQTQAWAGAMADQIDRLWGELHKCHAEHAAAMVANAELRGEVAQLRQEVAALRARGQP